MDVGTELITTPMISEKQREARRENMTELAQRRAQGMGSQAAVRMTR